MGVSRDVTSSTNGDVTTRRIGTKLYELTDHLGSVRALIPDIKLPSGDTFLVEPVSVYEYDAYGVMRVNRSADLANPYRYGFQGMLRMSEVAPSNTVVNDYSTLFRTYDARTGRWTSHDPILQPWESTYSGLAGNPAMLTDWYGLDADDGGPMVTTMESPQQTTTTTTTTATTETSGSSDGGTEVQPENPKQFPSTEQVEALFGERPTHDKMLGLPFDHSSTGASSAKPRSTQSDNPFTWNNLANWLRYFGTAYEVQGIAYTGTNWDYLYSFNNIIVGILNTPSRIWNSSFQMAATFVDLQLWKPGNRAIVLLGLIKVTADDLREDVAKRGIDGVLIDAGAHLISPQGIEQLGITTIDVFGTGLAGRGMSVGGSLTTMAVNEELGAISTLYRAVSKAELDDIATNGLRSNPIMYGYQTEKLFATSAQDASIWGQSFFHWDQQAFTIVEVRVPRSVMERATYFRADGRQAVSIRSEDLPQLHVHPLNYIPWR